MSWYEKVKQSLSDKEIDDKTLKEWDAGKWIPVQSSFISDVAYYEASSILEVKLKNGQEYKFLGVPKKVFKNFLKSKSKGEFFNRVIKKNYGRSNSVESSVVQPFMRSMPYGTVQKSKT